MPHVHLEYSRALAGSFDPRRVALQVHEALAAHAGAAFEDCKARLLPVDETVIGGGAPGAFAHLGIAILSGRTVGQKQALADAAFAALADSLAGGGPVQISVEIRDMDKASYRKARVEAGT